MELYVSGRSRLPRPAHGRVRGTTWHKYVSRSRHLYRRLDSWCVDLADLSAAEQAGLVTLVLHESEEQCVYRVSLGTMRLKGQLIDDGFGPQVALALEHWVSTDEATSPRASAPVQLALFGARR